ncbi:MAG: M48 family metallopeptidase [Candidatus Magasanikbacteria bacterium]|nr:M48 family metallopeptidase [Candidatus Magasanikbacteria bacterium]
MYSQIDSNKRKTNILILIFIIFVLGIGWFFNAYMGYGYGAVAFAMLVSIAMSLFSYYKGDTIALKSSGAKEIQKNDNPYLWRMVENLAITAGIPMPKIHIIDSPALNAFATGRDPEHASIAVTTGIIQALENEELEGVIAHELSHVKNFDIRVMTVVVVLVGSIALLSDFFFRAHFYGGRRGKDNKAGGIFMIIGLLALIISPVVAELIKLAISRKREFLADASGALLTRYPEALARALEKISASSIPLQRASAATAHLFISNPFKKKNLSSLFSTHPPIEERVKRLRET